MAKRILYVDPASISTGWALFEDGQLKSSGTIIADKRLPIFIRLFQIYKQYRRKKFDVEEVHIEQLVRNTHIYTHWSVCAIALGVLRSHTKVDADIPIQSWQKATDWKGEQAPLQSYKRRVSSEDELAAIAMGLYHSSRLIGVAKKSKRRKK